ncbi:hypothetical protein F5B22DRAFT_641220 [Xylaria bambusicola]|uniref:uncharacterized protein n=1 Tax=Xylaria bambusicola TaxID=326684 RepID=UPI0020084784|nr:uncharacterized protein F5B22DRAFT_641220 [Xylaria bambusicola]KAI0528247.1 hypothetical protein F5B22DRAFT_641220 [Xylaria bambusicola]
MLQRRKNIRHRENSRPPQHGMGLACTYATVLTTGHRTNNGIKLDTYSKPNVYDSPLKFNPVDGAQSHVLQLDASYIEHNEFPVTELGTSVEVFSISQEGPPYLAVHKLCYQLAERFISSRVAAQGATPQVSSEDAISSIEQLWKEREDDPEDAERVESNPLNISRLTESILKNLEPEPSERRKEIISGTDSDYRHTILPSVAGGSQGDWCDALVNKQLFPWLWDLDTEVVRKKQQESNWDWESLVRKLVQGQCPRV